MGYPGKTRRKGWHGFLLRDVSLHSPSRGFRKILPVTRRCDRGISAMLTVSGGLQAQEMTTLAHGLVFVRIVPSCPQPAAYHLDTL